MLCIVPVCKTTNIRSHNQRPSILRHHNITHRTGNWFLLCASVGQYRVLFSYLWYFVQSGTLYTPMRNMQCSVYMAPFSVDHWQVNLRHGGVHLPSEIQLFSVGICTQPVNLFQDGISINLLVCDGRVLAVPSDHRSKEEQRIATQCCQTCFFI